jgi:hypothetical protein
MKHKYHFLPATGVPDDSNAQGPPRFRSQLRVLAGILAGVNWDTWRSGSQKVFQSFKETTWDSRPCCFCQLFRCKLRTKIVRGTTFHAAKGFPFTCDPKKPSNLLRGPKISPLSGPELLVPRWRIWTPPRSAGKTPVAPENFSWDGAFGGGQNVSKPF